MDFFITLVAFLVTMVLAEEPADVIEGKDAVLECRFDPTMIAQPNSITFYWTRSNTRDKDNVAIMDTSLDRHYSVDYEPAAGRYDLRIKGATYQRDNGQFECKMKEGGTGDVLHSKVFTLTVLLKPGPPTVSPSGLQATEGSVTKLECSSRGGSPDPQIRWYRRGVAQPLNAEYMPGGNKEVPTRSILSFNPRPQDDKAEFKCVVWNRALEEGQRLETTTRISVDYFPRVRVGPENPVRVIEGRATRLQCNVDSKPPVTGVSWIHKGRTVSNSMDYLIAHAEKRDAGTYICSADNGLGRPGRGELQVDVLYPPVLRADAKKEVDERADVTVTCTVLSHPPPTIEWLKLGDDTFRQSGPTLRLKHVTSANSGVYVCKALVQLDTSGSSSKILEGNTTTTVLVRHKPGKTKIFANRRVAIDGKSITLKCLADPEGWPSPTYRWWKQGSDETLSMGQNYSLHIARLSSEGTYYCQPSNILGEGTQGSFDLSVHSSPTLVTLLPPNDVRDSDQKDFTATCSAEGKPKPAIRWLHNDKIVSADDWEIEVQESEGKSGTFTVQSMLRARRPLKHTDRGRYTCSFSNDVGKADTVMQLRIKHKPVPEMKKTKKVSADIGESGLLVCLMAAYPPPLLTWSRNHLGLVGDGLRYETNTTALEGDVYQTVLKVLSVSKQDYGRYVCQGRNDLGEDRMTLLLQPKGAPETPGAPYVVAAGYHWIQLGWEEGFNGGYGDTVFMVLRRVTGRSGEKELDCQMKNPCNITGLEQQTTYSFKVKAYNKGGESQYSASSLASTAVDISEIPSPDHVTFDRSSRQVSFNVIRSKLQLAPLLTLRKDGQTKWKKVAGPPITSTKGEVQVPEEEASAEEIQLKLCLVANTSLCGEPVFARDVTSAPSSAVIGRLPLTYVIPIAVSCAIVLGALLVMFFCCCRKQKKDKNYEMDQHGMRPSLVTADPPPPYSYNGVENKGVGAEETNPHGNPYVYASQASNGGVNMGYLDNSYSNHGGSVNSQDSLWQMKNSGELAPDRPYTYNPLEPNGGYHYDEYNCNEDYYNQRNLISGDPYDAHRDVSGLPDPYMNDGEPQPGPLVYDEAMESGYSTPNARNRRVIREIIV